MSEEDPLPLLPAHEQSPVPVFSCHVIIGPAGESGKMRARVANLSGITTEGDSERQLLTAIVSRFKAVVQKHAAAGEKIPFAEEPEVPVAGEVERFIPIHL